MFNKITFKQIKELIEIVFSSSEQDFEFVWKKYQSTAENFESVLSLLTAIEILSVEDRKIMFTDDTNQFLNTVLLNSDLIKGLVLEKLLNSSNSFSREVFHYLRNFKFSTNKFEYKPSTVDKLKESDFRNLLVELDFIRYDRIKQSYYITDEYFLTFANYIEKQKITSKELSYLLGKRKEIGEAAELEVIQYEFKRLANFPELLKHLEHTSKANEKAGYDIKSWETDTDKNKGMRKPRYIEVKAVSELTFRFNWTRNEIDKSKFYGNEYYLYLLPVIRDKKFDIRKLEIIQNPFEKVFKNSTDWKKQIEKYSLWKKK